MPDRRTARTNAENCYMHPLSFHTANREAFTPLRHDDLDAALGLSRQAGWNQTEGDWRRLLELHPDSCFAWREDGILAGTGTLAIYGGEVAWIGMVIVGRTFRGRGIGKKMLDELVRTGKQRGCRIIGLDAT